MGGWAGGRGRGSGPRATPGGGRGVGSVGPCEEARQRRPPGRVGPERRGAGAGAVHSLAGPTLTDSPAARASYSPPQRRPGAAPPTAHARSARRAQAGGARSAARARGAGARAGAVGASASCEQPRDARRRQRPWESRPGCGSGGARREGRARSPPPSSFPPLPPARLSSLLFFRSSPVFLFPLPLAPSSSSFASSHLWVSSRGVGGLCRLCVAEKSPGSQDEAPRRTPLGGPIPTRPLPHLPGPTGAARAECPGFIPVYRFEVSPG